MALQQRCVVLFLLVLVPLCCTRSAVGKLECEELPVEDCAFAVSSTGERCVLEKYVTNNDDSVYECQTSIILADQREAYIENDYCIKACGLEKLSVGFSSDGFLVRKFLEKLCSSSCQDNCPNVVDLFSKLAAGDGLYLPKICNFLKPAPRRLFGIRPKLVDRTNSLIDSWKVAAAPAGSNPFSTSGLAEAPM